MDEKGKLKARSSKLEVLNKLKGSKLKTKSKLHIQNDALAVMTFPFFQLGSFELV